MLVPLVQQLGSGAAPAATSSSPTGTADDGVTCGRATSTTTSSSCSARSTRPRTSRTWHATVLAALDIAAAEIVHGGSTSRRRLVTATVRHVAEHLGTRRPCAEPSYIDPRVFDRFLEGRTIAPALDDAATDDDTAREAVERAVLDLLDGSDVAIAA